MAMTPEAKRALSSTIRGLRERLLSDLHDATDSAYRLSVRTRDAGLSEAAGARRARLEGWIDEQLRGQSAVTKTAATSKASKKNGKTKKKAGKSADSAPVRTRDAIRRDAEKQAAYTFLNRLVILRLMEASGLRSRHVLTGGWESPGYKNFRHLAKDLTRIEVLRGGGGDESEGFAFLLKLIFEDLSGELPGLYGAAGVADLIPVPASTLRHVIEALDEDALESCWTDDMTLGWIYQYWNDPEREALDAKLNDGGKVEPSEIASKTQMFTERYMVDWLLQNSLGPMWLAMCTKHGWTAECESSGTLSALEERRIEWRAKRELGSEVKGGVELTALMPLHNDQERRWAYYVPQPIPESAVELAPESIRGLKILDPAVGSGHFLMVAFDLLFALYREEARHRGEQDDDRWSDRAIACSILESNLHGIDLDPRAVQIAAAALWLKCKAAAPGAQPAHLNLVASNLALASLPEDDPSLVQLRREVETDTGIPAALTDSIIDALRGADHLGTLLKVDVAITEALRQHEGELSTTGDLFAPQRVVPRQVAAGPATGAEGRGAGTRADLVARIEDFLSRHDRGDDLGLRLVGEQLGRGIRFLRLVQEDTYDLVVGNPPYQGTSKLSDSAYVVRHYPRGKADLYAAFLERGLQLARRGGVSALLTMRNWMFIKQYAPIREWLLETYDLRALHDVSSGAFEEISAAQVVVSVVTSIFAKTATNKTAITLKSFDDDTVTQVGETQRKRAATLCQVGRHEFDPAALKVVPEWPLVYWWGEDMLRTYQSAPLIGDVAPATFGATTGNNARYVRRAWETPIRLQNLDEQEHVVPFINGAKGRAWVESLNETMQWRLKGLGYRTFCEISTGANFRSPHLHFQCGVAFSMIGAGFSARVHRYPSIFGNKGSSVFPDDLAAAACAMNSTRARHILSSLNPGIGFEVGDVNRLPLFRIRDATTIFATVDVAFSEHEAHREVSVEFRGPGPSAWECAQSWAQTAVDRPSDAPLPPYAPTHDPEPRTDHISFALGVALGRLGANGEGILDPSTLDEHSALPAGICFLNGTLDKHDLSPSSDSLGAAQAKIIHDKWKEYGRAIEGLDIKTRADVRAYLRLKFFGDVHRQMYDNRPIHWPLSSEKKTFVAWINIHRWNAQTLRVLLAEHLHPAQTRLEGQLADLRAARDGADQKAASNAEKHYDKVLKWRDELTDFVAAVTECAEKGPPPTDPKCPPRDRDARYDPDLDDGVMINSAALWPLLLPQWKAPKKWWKELATSKGKKDYDWSHLAMRYWPTRVDAKCQADPSLGVAHGCFWRLHPARAWAWELRLQDEIAPDFRIEEPPYHPDGLTDADHAVEADTGDAAHRAAYLEHHPAEALAAVEREALRRRGRGKDTAPIAELRLLEPGLWTTLPAECWALEDRISEKQEAEFRLLAPDEPEARAAYERAHPERTKERAERSQAQPNGPLFESAVDVSEKRPDSAQTVEQLVADWQPGDLDVQVSESSGSRALLAVLTASPEGLDEDRAHIAARFAFRPHRIALLALGTIAEAEVARVLQPQEEAAHPELNWRQAYMSLEKSGSITCSNGRFQLHSSPFKQKLSEEWRRRGQLGLVAANSLTEDRIAEVLSLFPSKALDVATRRSAS